MSRLNYINEKRPKKRRHDIILTLILFSLARHLFKHGHVMKYSLAKTVEYPSDILQVSKTRVLPKIFEEE